MTTLSTFPTTFEEFTTLEFPVECQGWTFAFEEDEGKWCAIAFHENGTDLFNIQPHKDLEHVKGVLFDAVHDEGLDVE